MDNQQGPAVQHRELLNVMWQPGWEGVEGEWIRVCMAQSLCCPPETITLSIGYTPLQNKKFN